MMEETIDKKTTTWSNKMAISAIVILVLGTNAFNTYVQGIFQNKEKIEYNESANKRRTANAIQTLKFEITIKDLEKDLKDCEK